MANKKPKGNQFLAEAHKKMKSSAKNFGGLLGGNSGQEDAIELLLKAANSFKADKKWNAAGSAFCEAAVIYLQNNNKQSAGTAYVSAGNCYKKTDTQEAISCLLKAIDIYKNMGKYKIAAKHHMTVAEIYEKELVDTEKANIHYQKATHYYKMKEPSKTNANGCLQKVTTTQSIEETVLWRRPINTLYYATHELIYQLINLTKWVLCHTRTCSTLLLLSIVVTGISYMDGPHQHWLILFRKQLLWCLYWCGLGILSSVGLGTGLHTFLLYLGPHIASVTLAAYECDSLDFPSPPYPDEIICPTTTAQSLLNPVNVWSIMSKVRLEAFMWGAGTALGELPPYFVARAHRLAGEEEEELDPDLAQEIVATSSSSAPQKRHKSLAQRFRTQMIRLVTKVGFFGILGCASIPNPLFDLAGITCGYSLVPFWTFFGATLIGKAIIKMHIQKLFVIIAFNENYFEMFVHKSRNIPFVGQYLHEPLREFLVKQKKSLHRGSAKQTVKESSYLSMIFEWIVISMIVYFLVSIINSMAQNYQKRALKHSTSENSEQHINNSNHLKTF